MIRKAALRDAEAIEKGYLELFAYEREHGAYTVWKEGVYPTRETIGKSLSEGSMYVLERDGEICASMIGNRSQPEEYGGVAWRYRARPEEVFVVHLLCVRPSKAGQGIGKDMVQFAVAEAGRMGCKTVRLDTGAQNTPAAALYRKMGFELAGTAPMAVGGRIAHGAHLFFEKKAGN